MKKVSTFVILAAIFGIGVYGIYLAMPLQLVITSGNKAHMALSVRSGDCFSLRFIHSVHRTPVTENFKIRDSRSMVLYSTEYDSYGVGMPFSPEEGLFRQQGGKFVLEGLDRQFKTINARTGPEAKISLIYKEKIYPLYEYFPSGTPIEISIEPYYFRWIPAFFTYR